MKVMMLRKEVRNFLLIPEIPVACDFPKYNNIPAII